MFRATVVVVLDSENVTVGATFDTETDVLPRVAEFPALSVTVTEMFSVSGPSLNVHWNDPVPVLLVVVPLKISEPDTFVPGPQFPDVPVVAIPDPVELTSDALNE